VSNVEHRVRALNQPGSPNLVHDDEFARRLGFRSGLVAGVTVYGYMAVLPARVWGGRWLAGGAMSARFLKPVYDGEEVTVRATGAGNGLDLELRNPAGELCASGHADPLAEGPPPLLERYPAAQLPVPAGPPVFEEGQPLGSLSTSVRLGDHAWPARLANEALVANVRLPPWIHVESRARHLAPVRDGERAEVRAVVVGLWERRGHRFVDLDVLVLGESSTPLAQLRHVAIYELAQLRATG
jgi:acyl dehydratase